MKAWQVTEWCEPSEMKYVDIPPPEPGPGEVRICTGAAAMNFFDILQVQGKYQIRPPFPFTPGGEVAGTVDAVGPGVTAFRPGDRVMAMVNTGGYAEQTIASASECFRMPEKMSFAEGAAMPIVYQTSYFALKYRAALKPGEWLLVHAAAGGVGSAAVQIGKAMGAKVIACVGGTDKFAFCREQGADHCLDYCEPSWVDSVKEITGGYGADVIYDPVGGDVFDLSTKCIAFEGRLLVIGFAGGRIPSIQANRILLKNISVVGLHWGEYRKYNPGLIQTAQEELFALYAVGKIRPVVQKTYPLAASVEGLKDLAERRVLGKSVLVTGG